MYFKIIEEKPDGNDIVLTCEIDDELRKYLEKIKEENESIKTIENALEEIIMEPYKDITYSMTIQDHRIPTRGAKLCHSS